MCALFQAVDLEVDESSFTGETIPSRKSTLPQVCVLLHVVLVFVISNI